MIGVGSKVVCIKTSRGIGRIHGDPCNYPNGRPMKGRVYVVSAMKLAKHDGLLILRLIGRPVFNLKSGQEIWHNSQRFRELSEYRQAQELEYYKSLPVHAPL